MSRTIRLRYPASCRDCGADLPAGSRARYYGRGRVYGLECHDKSDTAAGSLADWHDKQSTESHATTFSSGVTIYQNRNGRCEDAPCCGCCT